MSRIDLKTLENGLGGRERPDFGTVRTRVQIPRPRPILYSKSAILDVAWSRRITAGSQFPSEPRERGCVRLTGVSRSELARHRSVVAERLHGEDVQGRTVRHWSLTVESPGG